MRTLHDALGIRGGRSSRSECQTGRQPQNADVATDVTQQNNGGVVILFALEREAAPFRRLARELCLEERVGFTSSFPSILAFLRCGNRVVWGTSIGAGDGVRHTHTAVCTNPAITCAYEGGI